MNDLRALRRCTVPLAVAAVAALVPGALAAAERGDPWEKYRLLAERNIFVRGRRAPPPPRPDRPTEPEPARPVESPLVLTGTARSGEAFVAFFEDARTGETVRAGVGGTVRGGRVKAISLDAVAYEVDGTVTQVEIGHSLTGEPVALPRPLASSPAEPAPETGGEVPGPPDGEREAPETPAEDGEEADEKETDGQEEAESSTGNQDADLADILQRMRRRREQELRR